jgi:hypothetical protein
MDKQLMIDEISTLRSCLRLPAILAFFAITAVCASKTNYLKNYKGTPDQDSRYQGGRRRFPDEWNAPTMIAVEKESLIMTPILRTTAAEASIPRTERT